MRLLIHFIVFTALTFLMFYIKEMFYISEDIPHPQFLSDDFDGTMNKIISAGKLNWFYYFFATDLVWSFFLCTIFPHVIYVINVNRSVAIKKILIPATLAWIFDLLEGVLYTSGALTGLIPFIRYIKLTFYLLTFVIFVFMLLGRVFISKSY